MAASSSSGYDRSPKGRWQPWPCARVRAPSRRRTANISTIPCSRSINTSAVVALTTGEFRSSALVGGFPHDTHLGGTRQGHRKRPFVRGRCRSTSLCLPGRQPRSPGPEPGRRVPGCPHGNWLPLCLLPLGQRASEERRTLGHHCTLSEIAPPSSHSILRSIEAQLTLRSCSGQDSFSEPLSARFALATRLRTFPFHRDELCSRATSCEGPKPTTRELA
jgi:hypothetical protein